MGRLAHLAAARFLRLTYRMASWISDQVPEEPGSAMTMSEERMLMWLRLESSVPVMGCMESGHCVRITISVYGLGYPVGGTMLSSVVM